MSDPFNNEAGGRGNALPYLCGSWPKGRDTVQISITEYKGNPLIDLRIWYPAPDGELKPSPKGLTLTLDALSELFSALGNARAAAESMGLLAKVGAQ